MEKLIFACFASGKDFNPVLWAASIRKFAGSLSNSPIWVIIPDSRQNLDHRLEKKLVPLNVEIISCEPDLDIKSFPFANYVRSTAMIESSAENKTEILVCMISDTLVLKEPTSLILEKGINFGYRPVHHTLIGSIYNQPVTPFWELIYDKCKVSKEKMFPMRTHVDHNVLRPYFNAGFLIVRPKFGLLQAWWNLFKEIYEDSDFKAFYDRNELYTIFIHQAVLAGVILSRMKRSEVYELPFEYNYPLHLYPESPDKYKPKNLEELVTVRYEKTTILEKASFKEPVRTWILQYLETFS